MEKEIEDLIADWNTNTYKLSSKNIWGVSKKSPLELMDFCLKIHTKVDKKKLLISLNEDTEFFTEKIFELEIFIKTLEHYYHSDITNFDNKRNYKYLNEERSYVDIVFERKLEYKNGEIIIQNITQELINAEVVKEYKNKQYYSNEYAKFIFNQCSLNNYNSDILEEWILQYKTNVKDDARFLLLSELPSFFKVFFTLKSDIEKLEFWIKKYFVNNAFISFKEYLKIDIEKYGEEIINVFRNLYYKKNLKSYNSKLKKSINSEVFIQNEIKRVKELINNKPTYDFSFGDKPSIYRSYKALVDGNRDFFDDFVKKDRCGEVEAIQMFIDYLENQNLKNKKHKTVREFINSDSEELFPIEIFESTKGYLKKNAQQVIICYKYKAYDACFVLLRKIIEILIIELFEKEKIEDKIIDEDGNYFMLKKLIICFQKEQKFKKIFSRNINEALPKIKKNGDLSAHNRRFIARKADIDRLRDDFRIVFEELIHCIY